MSKHHLVFWDLPAEPRLPFALANQYGDFQVTPMTYAAWLTCQQIMPERCLPFEEIISTADRVALFSQSSEMVDNYFDRLSKRAPSWCAAVSPNTLSNTLYFALLAQKFIEQSSKVTGNASLVLYRPLGLSLMSNLAKLAFQCFNMVLDGERAGAVESLNERFNWTCVRAFAALANGFDHIIAHFDQWFMVKNETNLDVLFVAMDESDRRNQAPLVDRIRANHDITVQWLTVGESRLGVSADEAKLGKLPYDESVVRKLPRRLSKPQAAGCVSVRLSKTALKWHYYDAWRATCGALLSPASCRRMALLMANREGQLCSRHRLMRHLLAEFKPKVLVVNSFLGAMRSVQLEADRRAIFTILLPHGVSDFLGPAAYWWAQVIGRFGRLERDILERRFAKKMVDCRAIGGGHLGYMARELSAIRGDWPQGSIRILFPTTIPIPFLPHSPREAMLDTEQIVTAGMTIGARTVVRCHPRQKHHNFHDYEVMLRKIDASGWVLSDGSDSLVDSLASCHVVVVSHYSGAMVQALHAPRPIVCWMPRPFVRFSDQVMQRFPCRATTPEELASVYRRIQQNPEYRNEVLLKQKILLEELVEDPYGDPYAGSEALVLEMVRKQG